MGYRTSFYARSFAGEMKILHPQAVLEKTSSTFFKRWRVFSGQRLLIDLLFLLHIYERIQSRGRDCFGHSKNKCDADSGKGKDFLPDAHL